MQSETGGVGVIDPTPPEPELASGRADVVEGDGTAVNASGETELVRAVRYFTAICGYAAGVLHLLAMTAHADHHPTLGRAFLLAAIVQIVWATLLIFEPRKLFVAVGLLANLTFMVVWAFSRTKGISWFPGLEDVEALEWRDVTTQFFQLLAVAGAVVLLLPAWVHRPAKGSVPILPVAIMALLALFGVGLLYAATHDYSHDEGGADHSHTDSG